MTAVEWTPEQLALLNRIAPLPRRTTISHGATGYAYHGCRCEVCRRAHRERIAKRTQERAALLAAGEVDPPHGRQSTYANYLCRCDACIAAHSASMKAYRRADQDSSQAEPGGGLSRPAARLGLPGGQVQSTRPSPRREAAAAAPTPAALDTRPPENADGRATPSTERPAIKTPGA